MSGLLYDVETSVSAFREMSEKVAAEMLHQDIGVHAVIQLRNLDVSTAMLRMALTEANRGTPLFDIILGMGSIVAEFLDNATYERPADQRVMMYNLFAMHLSKTFEMSLQGEGHMGHVDLA